MSHATLTAVAMWVAVMVAILIPPLIMIFWMRMRGAATEEQVDRPKVAMPVDSEHPPSWKTYDPQPGSPTRYCSCHPDRPLVAGQRVLWWPVPNSGGAVHLFCQDAEVDQ